MFRIIFVLCCVFLVVFGLQFCAEEKMKLVVYTQGKEYEITDENKVDTVKEILHEAKWKDVNTIINRKADYEFIFQYKNKGIEAKAIPYSVWIDKQEQTATIMELDQKYVQLNKKDSERLLESIEE